jgi:hypothetical protein
MKRRIYLVLLFLFFFFLFDRGVSLIFRELNYSFYSKTELKKDIFGKMRVIKTGYYDMMIFGTSRTMDSIHPVYLLESLGIRAYKEAKPSRYPRYYYNFYKNFRSVYGKPKYLIYGIDYFIFNLATSDIHLLTVTKKKKKMKRLRLSKIRNGDSRCLNDISLTFRLKKKIDRTLSDLLYKLSLEWDSPDSQNNVAGINQYIGRKRVLRQEFRIKPSNWETFGYMDSSHGEGKYLKLLFDELENDGVVVILVGIPDYIGTYRSNSQQDRFIDDIDGLIRGRKNFRFINYNDPGRFDLSNPEYFTNGGYGEFNSHMSYYGALKFNELLCRDIRAVMDNKLPRNPAGADPEK